MPSLLDRLRSLRRPLETRRRWPRRSRQTSRVVLVAVACATLALLTVLQFQWIGLASDAHREAALRSLDSSMTLFHQNLKDELAFLLTSFRADAMANRAHRTVHYLERYYSWRESSSYGSAVKRILIYDKPIGKAGELIELSIEAQSVERVQWGQDLDGLRAHLDGFGFVPGRVISPRLMVTWMYYPAYSALVRPLAAVEADSSAGDANHVMAGYLILRLDLQYLTGRLLPEMMSQYFAEPLGAGLYDFAVSVDGEEAYLYRLSRRPGTDPPAQAESSIEPQYTLVRVASGNSEDRLGPPDHTRSLLLISNPVPNPVLLRGAVQRVSLRWRVGEIYEGGSARRLPSPGGEPSAGFAKAIATALARPRVFLVADETYRLELLARHVSGSLSQAMSARFRTSLAMGLGVVLLLAAAVSLVGLSARRAARLADLRMEFVAGVSHELRTPLAAIRLIGENISDGLLDSREKASQYGQLICEHGRRLSEMVENTLRLSAIESGEHHYNLTEVDVSRIARDALAEARPFIDQAGFVVEHAEVASLPPVKADEKALRQSLGNLLSNAVKYGLPGRWVKLETVSSDSASGKEVQIRVHDRGQGIPSAEASRIFDPFYRATGSRATPIPGSGLGLKLARDMVNDMGGRLSLQSEPGEGSVFTIHLPATS